MLVCKCGRLCRTWGNDYVISIIILPLNNKGIFSGTTIISGNQQIAMATQKAKEITTPSRQHQLPPSQIIKIEPTAGMDLKDIPENVQEALKEFCMKTIGKSVASFQQLKDELLHHQMSLPESNPLR